MSGLTKVFMPFLDPIRHVIQGLSGSDEVAAAPPPMAPTVEPPSVMPTPDDKAVQAAKKKSIAAQLQRQGRASTILSQTGNADALGG